jgi:hypothetical protein
VDVALTPGFPNATSEKSAVTQFLGSTLQIALCVTQLGAVRVILDNAAAGHDWPSGAAQDRRAWAEVIASKGGSVIYQSGVVPAGTPVTAVTNDPDLWLLRDCMFDDSSPPKQVDMFWQAASYEGNELPGQITFDAGDPDFYLTHVVQFFPRNQSAIRCDAHVRGRQRLHGLLRIAHGVQGGGDKGPGDEPHALQPVAMPGARRTLPQAPHPKATAFRRRAGRAASGFARWAASIANTRPSRSRR